MRSRVDLQTSGSLSQNSQPEIYQIHTEKNREEIPSVRQYDASITMIVSQEKTYKSRTFVLINSSQPEVTDHQGVRWSQAFFNPDGTFFVDLGEKVL